MAKPSQVLKSGSAGLVKIFQTVMMVYMLFAAACSVTGGRAGAQDSGGQAIEPYGNAGGYPSTGVGSPSGTIAIYPMSQVNIDEKTGYFEDPHPIYPLAVTTTQGLPAFSGTTKKLFTCAGEIQPGCLTSVPITLDRGPFTAATAQVGSCIHGFENLNIYQGPAGKWHMAVVAILRKPGLPSSWNVILHAHPTTVGQGVPTTWEADKLLVGNLGVPAPNNYDPKYFYDSGKLYLIYNKKVGMNQDGVVAQPMRSPTEPEPSDPVPLLGPETRDEGYNSELSYGLNQPSDIKLIEAANITRINGKYVLTYSVGRYDLRDYKVGIAYSDTFLPPPGGYYRRVQKQDVAGIWGQPNHPEVKYLLQSQTA